LGANQIGVSSPLKVRVNIPETVIKKFRKLPLTIYGEAKGDLSAPFLSINDHKWYRYNLKLKNTKIEDVVKIHTKILKSGENILKFYAGINTASQFINILELRFNFPKNNISSN
jgi:hypothetical protein